MLNAYEMQDVLRLLDELPHRKRVNLEEIEKCELCPECQSDVEITVMGATENKTTFANLYEANGGQHRYTIELVLSSIDAILHRARQREQDHAIVGARFCLDCRRVVALNKHGYCERCGSNAVTPA